MRVKRPSLVVTFRQTADAMAAERLCGVLSLPGRLIPIPAAISAGCGLAWKTGVGERERITAAFREHAVPWQAMEIVELWELAR